MMTRTIFNIKTLMATAAFIAVSIVQAGCGPKPSPAPQSSPASVSSSRCPIGQKDCSMSTNPSHVPHCTDEANYCCGGFGCEQPCVENKCP